MPNPSGKPGKLGDDGETPASNILWVGYMAADFSEAELMEIFADYGALDIVISPSTKSYAFAFFMCIEDAKAALEALHGTNYKGTTLKIEFAKPARPCKHLWIGGIGSSVTKEKLEESFRKFGKIEEVNFFRERNTAIIVFSKLEEASHALKIMNGKHISGDQIRVEYVRSLSTRRHTQLSENHKGDGQPSNVLWIGYPPTIKIDDQTLHNKMILFGEIESIKSFPERNYSFVEFRSVDEARSAKEGLQGRLLNDPRITIMYSSSGLAPGKGGAGFHPGSKGLGTDVGYGHNHSVVPNAFHGPGILGRPYGLPTTFDHTFTGHEVIDNNPLSMVSSNKWNMSPPSLTGVRHPIRPHGNFDTQQYEREAKRSRLDAFSIGDDRMTSAGYIEDGATDMYSTLRRRSPLGSIALPSASGLSNQENSDDDHIWRGVIAKGGTPVCHARCVPVRKGSDWDLPDMVNCYARTGLDMLEKHYAEALGIEIVYFLPDCEEDFDSYTEFLRYLGDKHRAGVAKLDDGTTLFLVPPSDFLTKILNGAGPKRLYGVVLNLPQAPIAVSTAMKQQFQQAVPSPHYSDRQYVPQPQANYSQFSREESPYRMDKGVSEDPLQIPKPNFPPVDSFNLQQPVPQDTGSAQPRVTLTPELIATLANIIPGTKQSVIGSSQQPSDPSTSWSSSAAPGTGLLSHDWKEDHASGQMSYVPQHLGSQYNPQAQYFPPAQTYPSVSNNSNHVASMGQINTDVHDHGQQQSFNISRPLTSLTNPPQSGQYGAYQQTYQPYEPEAVHSGHTGYGLQRFEQQYDLANVPSQSLGSSFPQSQSGLPSVNGSSELQHHSAASGSGLASDVDKSQKYQSTLAFAANLLQQLQQHQQQQPFGPGSGSH